MTPYRFGAYVISALLLFCNGGCVRRSQTITPLEPDTAATFFDETVKFCSQRQIDPRPAKVQVLLDSSGSMVGFKPMMPGLVSWFQQSISLLQRTTIEIEKDARTCEFSTKLGIGNCRPLNAPLQGYGPSTDTNLNEAILSATDFELSLIVTDGAAYTGVGGSGDCAGGVDAACVARSLHEVIQSTSLEASDEDWGIWMVPLMATYAGRYFTEQRLPVEDFQAEIAVSNIRDDIGSDAVIDDPGLISDGTLAFDYRGPRAMVLIVLARYADLGRAAVQALSERSEFVGIRHLASLRSFESATGVMAPIEVYPGLVSRVEWQTLQRSPNPTEALGTIDAGLTASGDQSEIRVNCPPQVSGEAIFELAGETPRVTRVSGCVDIHLLPALSFRLQPQVSAEETHLATFLKGYQRAGEDYSQLRLHLTCGPQTVRGCDGGPLAVEWRAYMNYGRVADCLADSSCVATVPSEIRNLSTLQPSQAPHKVYGFAQILEELYRAVAANQRSTALADFDLCRGVL